MHTPIDNLKMTWAWDGSGGSITQKFGTKAKIYTDLGMNGHNGWDLVAPWNTPLRAVCRGVVKQVNRDATGYGRHIRLLDTHIDVNGWQENWVYGHCESIFVNEGDIVEAGQIIGTMGNTGFVVSKNPDGTRSGTHLHLGVRKETYRNGVRVMVKNYANGYYGYYDFKEELSKSDRTATSKEVKSLSFIGIATEFIRQLKVKLEVAKALKEIERLKALQK